MIETTTYDGYLFGADFGLIVYGRQGDQRVVVVTAPAATLPVAGSLNAVARDLFIAVVPAP